jgi:hypothetical protein
MGTADSVVTRMLNQTDPWVSTWQIWARALGGRLAVGVEGRTARRVLAALACEAAGVDVAAALAATGPDVPEDERHALLEPLRAVADQWAEVVDMLTASPRGAVGSCRCGCGGELSLADHGSASGYKSWCEVRVRRARSAPSD